MLKVSFKGLDRDGKLQRLQRALAPEERDRVVDRVALQGHRMVVEATPKKWFGQVRRAWQIQKPQTGIRVLVNDNKIMFWLEEGTKAHGPVKARALYIPLTRAASFGYKPGFRFGRDFVMAKRVKGIQARWIARKTGLKIQAVMLTAMKAHIRKALA
jgi:hypothetical protein